MLLDLNNAEYVGTNTVSGCLVLLCVHEAIKAPTLNSILLLAATTIQFAKEIVTQVYYNYNWLNPPFRYFAIYLGTNIPYAIFYYAYKNRLESMLSSQSRIFAFAMWSLIISYIILTVIVTITYMYFSTNTSDGGYASNGVGAVAERIVVYGCEILLSAVVLIATFVTTQSVEVEVRQTQSRAATKLILEAMRFSDAIAFSIIVAINVYKVLSVVPGFPLFSIGAPVPFGHVLDVTKGTIMIVNLVITWQDTPSDSPKMSSIS
ncbi:hypothetical protein HDU83_005005 [Entophlyctis luteolus]|nr:hypothetical protein HDU83_005005 [Entophlyctis luteolus]KAJ3388323.1 hypothetical protein HDU84_009837 [Entophlyctis sp. JEL0112]